MERLRVEGTEDSTPLNLFVYVHVMNLSTDYGIVRKRYPVGLRENLCVYTSTEGWYLLYRFERKGAGTPTGGLGIEILT